MNAYLRRALYLAALALTALLVLLVAQHPSEPPGESPRDYAYGIDLTLTGQTPFYGLDVPRGVYEGVLSAELADLRVFNAAGEVVPYAFRPRVTRTTAPPPTVAVPLYPLRTTAEEGANALDLRVEHSASGTVIDLRAPEGVPAADAPLVGYVADVTAIQQALQAVDLDLPAGATGIVVRVTLEASDDLRVWRPLATEAPVLQLVAGKNRLERRRIEFAPQPVQYLRVRWPGRETALVLAGLRVAPVNTAVEVRREWKDMEVLAVAQQRNRYEADLGGLFPVDRLTFTLPQTNTVATLGIYARPSTLDLWAFDTNATVYRLDDEGGDLYSADVQVSGVGNRYWRFAFDPRGGGIGTGDLGVRAGWVPHRLVFAARGAPPFKLVYGRRGAQSVGFPIATLVPGYKDGATAASLHIGAAHAQSPYAIAGERALEAHADWKRIALWCSLVLSVGVLGAMAWLLARQMSVPKQR
jgi:Protein of unknown function (DUF3999)